MGTARCGAGDVLGGEAWLGMSRCGGGDVLGGEASRREADLARRAVR